MDITANENDGVAVLGLTGSFRQDEEEEVRKAVENILDGNVHNIVVNMAGISSITSQGLSVLIMTKRKIEQMGGAIKLAQLRPTIRELFEFTRLHTVFEIYESDDQAIASFRKG